MEDIPLENSDLRNINTYIALMQGEKNQKLLESALFHKMGELKLWLKAGAEVDSTNPNGDTALKIGAENGFTEIVDALIQAGANLETKNQSGQGVLSSAVKKNRIRTTTLLFSVMTQEQVNKAILDESLMNVPSLLSTRTIPRYFEKFKQLVVTHRMSIFEKLGPLFADDNPDNPFFHLLPELRELILLTYCLAESNESWKDWHSTLDAKAIFAALNKNKLLTFSPKLSRNNQGKLEENNQALGDSMSKTEIIIEEEKPTKPQKNKTRSKFHPRNYSPNMLRKKQQQSEEDSALEEAISKLEISPKLERPTKPKETKVRKKLNPRHYSPNLLRRNQKQAEEESGLEDAMSQLEIAPKETKTKSKYKPLTFSPKLFRKNSEKSQESLSSEEEKQPKTKKSLLSSFVRK